MLVFVFLYGMWVSLVFRCVCVSCCERVALVILFFLRLCVCMGFCLCVKLFQKSCVGAHPSPTRAWSPNHLPSVTAGVPRIRGVLDARSHAPFLFWSFGCALACSFFFFIEGCGCLSFFVVCVMSLLVCVFVTLLFLHCRLRLLVICGLRLLVIRGLWIDVRFRGWRLYVNL